MPLTNVFSAATVVILRRQGCRYTAAHWRHWQVCALLTVVQGTQVVPAGGGPLLLPQASFLKSSLGHADCHDANVDIYGHNSADNSEIDVNQKIKARAEARKSRRAQVRRVGS